MLEDERQVRAPRREEVDVEESAIASALSHTANVPRYLRGRNYNWWGENVEYSYQSDLGSLQRAFMNSPLHRRNILNGAYDRVGIGVERHDDRVWVTLVFYG